MSDRTLANCPLDRATPFEIHHVSQSQFSIARFAGGCSYNGQLYVYDNARDVLVRDDVRKWMAGDETKRRRGAQ